MSEVNLKIEIVEIYKSLIRKNTWSCHVYVIDLDLDIRGILVFYEKNRLFVKHPISKNKDETGKNIVFPILSFANAGKNKIFKKEIEKLLKNEIIKREGLIIK